MSTILSLTGTVNFEKRDIDSLLAAKIIALVEQDNSVGGSQALSSSGGFIGAGEIENASKLFVGRGLIEAFTETSAKTNMQRIAVAGQRAVEENDTDFFTAKDLTAQFKTAGISSANLARDIRKAISQGLIYAETGAKGQYRLTEKAFTGFREGFDQIKLPSPRVSTKKSRAGGATTKVEVSDEVKNLKIETTLEGYPDYYEFKVKGERIMWLLAFASNSGLESLNSKEIEYLARTVSDQIDASSVPALTVVALKKSMLAKHANKYRILHKGLTYLQGK
jgi:hypothetical protein